MPIHANMKGVSEEGNSCAPAGVYLLHIHKATEDTAKDSGNDMFKLELKIKYDAQGNPEHKGVPVFDYLVFAGKARARVKMAYHQLGLPCDDDNMEFSSSDIMDMDIWAVLTVDTYDGREQNKVTFDGYHRKYVPNPLPKMAVDGAFRSAAKADDEIPF